MIKITTTCILVMGAVGLWFSPAMADQRPVIGVTETVRILPGGILLEARVDTGAKTSSINARSIQRFVRDGGDWVRFELAGDAGKTTTVERPVLRFSRIRRTGVGVDERLVVNLEICLGGYLKNAEVNVTDRSRMTYPVLIGRRFLGDRFLIDPSAEHLSKPDCRDGKSR